MPLSYSVSQALQEGGGDARTEMDLIEQMQIEQVLRASMNDGGIGEELIFLMIFSCTIYTCG